jgi:pimeloyl-ACP methyl ester carboxylesterase
VFVKAGPFAFAAVIVGGAFMASGQSPSVKRPLALSQTSYRLRAGERVALPAPSETLAFMLTAKTGSARASGASDRGFPVAPNVAGDQVLLGVPLTTEPGDYSVAVSFVNQAGEERAATFALTVEPFATVAGSGVPPVVLLDGWQLSLTSSCPMSSDSTQTFGNLQSYLGGSPNFVPTVYFFENCTECPNCPLEELGADLGTFLNSINYGDGTPVPQADVVAHSMGGLIVRSYLSGKEQASGAFSPPATEKIRKAVFIATPHFGSFQADSTLADILFAAGNQTNEMKRGSQFLWDLATWNQFGDDLRGVDALAVIGNAGPFNGLSQASDGVVVLSSASLDFASPGRTRIVDYCHIPPGSDLGLAGDYLDCTEPGIAYIDSPSHQTYQIVSAFLMDSSTWQGIGDSPAQDQYLSKYGGMVVADVSTSDQFVGGLSEVSWDSVNLSNGAASGELFYNDFVDGSGSFAFGSSTCGPFTATAGIYSAVRCKFGPSIHSVGPLIPGPGRVVQAGATITISGTGFGAEQCAACQVTASNPESTALQVFSWSNAEITALLPASFGVGLAKIGVTAASGSEAINVMAGTVAAPPAISLSKSSLSFAFTVGGATPPAQSVTVANSGGGTLTWSASSNVSWLNVSSASGTLTVSINPAGLTPGPYSGVVSVSAVGASNSPQAVSVALTVTAPAAPPSISLSKTQASFTCGVGCKAPAPQTISIYNSGGGALLWSATPSASWILVSSAYNSVSISVNPTHLSTGRYTGSVSVTAAGASNSPQSIAVTLTVVTGGRHIRRDLGN